VKTSISTQTATIVADTLPAIVGKRPQFEEAMAGHMARRGPFDPAKNRHRVTSAAIADMLLDHAGGLGSDGKLTVIPHHGHRHRRMAIDGEH
jgi:hypothetical protein